MEAKFKVGDWVMSNLQHPKVKADLKVTGWTEAYYKFLNGHIAYVTEVLTNPDGQITYELEVDPGVFYVESEDMVIAAGDGIPKETLNNSKKASSALDKQVSGNHYKDFKIQPVEYIYANNIPFLEANVIKYTSRHRAKNKAADIKKAIHCLELILQLEYGE